MTGLFYKQFWDIVGVDKVNMVKDFSRRGHMLTALNHSFITLIPKSDLVNDRFSSADAEWILNQCSPLTRSLDRLIWTPDAKGVFTVKSAYSVLYLHVVPITGPLPVEDWKTLWTVPLQDRLRLLFWKSAWKILPCKTRTCWSVRPIEEDLACTLCRIAPESLEHLLFECSISCMAWMESPWALNVQVLTSRSIADWIKTIFAQEQV